MRIRTCLPPASVAWRLLACLLPLIAVVGVLVLPAPARAQVPPVRWERSVYGPGGVEAALGCGGCVSDQRAAAVDAAGDLVVAGYVTTAAGVDWKTAKFSGATGALLWEATFDSPSHGPDQSYAMTLDAAGNAIVSGYLWSGADGDIRTIKYAAADGAVAWAVTLPGVAGGNDFGLAIAADAAGNVVVGGNTWNGTNDDMRTVKYAAADGAVLWDRTFAGTPGGNGYVFALAIDALGNAIVAGERQEGAHFAWKVLKYAAADGAVLWEKTHAGAAGGDSVPYAIAIDAQGDALVAGTSHNGANADLKVIKYAAADGAVLWEKTHAGAGGGDDMAYALALDAAGDVAVTGFSFNGADNDWLTLKLASADGATLWQRSFAGAGNLSDVSTAIAIDGAGDVIVAGRTHNGLDRDLHARKYRGATGAPAWTYVHAGTAPGFDRAAALALAPGAVFIAGESTEAGAPLGWRLVKLHPEVLAAFADQDGDGIPNAVEPGEGLDAFTKDNDVFASARLFAMQQYRDFLGREADATGIGYWVAQLAGAQSRAQAVAGFLQSPEFQGAYAPVARLFFACFLRVPDLAGLRFHGARLRAGTSLAAVADDFASSAEFVARYGALSDDAYVELVYRNVLGRPPDPAGKAYWLARIAGGFTRGQVMAGFSESPEHAAAIANEVYTSMMFLGLLRRAPEPAGFAYWVRGLDGGLARAAMTQAFLDSAEYRARFLP